MRWGSTGRGLEKQSRQLHHLYYPAEELIFKHSNNVAGLACTFKQSNNIFHLG